MMKFRDRLSVIMLGFGLWWLSRAEAAARNRDEGYGEAAPARNAAGELIVRERATTASTFDPAEIGHGHQSVKDWI